MCLSVCECVHVCESRACLCSHSSRGGDSINQSSGDSGQQFMTTRLTGQGGAEGSKIAIPKRSPITPVN